MCWLVWTTLAPELQHIRDSHVACPVPLFNLNGHFVFPAAAKNVLLGATVLVRFMMVVKIIPVVVMGGLLDYMVLL